MTHRLLGPAFAAGLLSLTIACSSSGKSATTAPPNSDLTVRAESGITWDSKTYSATAHGGELVITAINDSSEVHNFNVIDSTGTANPVTIDLPKKGSSGTKTFSLAPGTYTLICKIPGHSNMKATLTVS